MAFQPPTTGQGSHRCGLSLARVTCGKAKRFQCTTKVSTDQQNQQEHVLEEETHKSLELAETATHQNRKILEQLEEQKKRLRMQNQAGVPVTSAISTVPGLPAVPPPASSPMSVPTPGVPQMIVPDSQPMTPAQRTALQHANANSVGYFITQDSSFGNLILPVLPRFETK